MDASSLSLIRADLSSGIFDGVNFFKANFFGADLSQGSFCDCNFSHVRFVTANLTGADFTRADYSGADFSRANVEGMNVAGVIGISEHNFNTLLSWGARIGMNIKSAHMAEPPSHAERVSSQGGTSFRLG